MTTTTASCVIHFRNVQPSVNQSDIVTLCNDFGLLDNIIMLNQTHQALVEFKDISSAISFMSRYSSDNPPVIGSTPIYPQFSSHQHITKQNSPLSNSYSNSFGSPSQTSSTSQSYAPNRILHVAVLNIQYPITLDVFGQIFNSYEKNRASVEKILIFNNKRQKDGKRNDSIVQALIQFSQVEFATQALQALNGKNIYNNCCTLDIKYSTLNQVDITENTDRAHDYITRGIPTTSRGLGTGSGAGGGGFGKGSLLGGSVTGGNAYGGYGNDGTFGGSVGGGWQSGNYGGGSGVVYQQKPQNNFYGSSSSSSGFGGGVGVSSGGIANSVIIVSGFPSTIVGPDHLFHLFSSYGQIVRIKILNKKVDTALIQYSSPIFASTALACLNGVRLFGKYLKIDYSRIALITPPLPAAEGGDGKTVDYENSTQNRFNYYSEESVKKMHAPTNHLHVSNLSPSTTSEQLSKHLSQEIEGKGGSVVDLKMFDNSQSLSAEGGGVGRDGREKKSEVHGYCAVQLC